MSLSLKCFVSGHILVCLSFYIYSYWSLKGFHDQPFGDLWFFNLLVKKNPRESCDVCVLYSQSYVISQTHAMAVNSMFGFFKCWRSEECWVVTELKENTVSALSQSCVTTAVNVSHKRSSACLSSWGHTWDVHAHTHPYTHTCWVYCTLMTMFACF